MISSLIFFEGGEFEHRDVRCLLIGKSKNLQDSAFWNT